MPQFTPRAVAVIVAACIAVVWVFAVVAVSRESFFVAAAAAPTVASLRRLSDLIRKDNALYRATADRVITGTRDTMATPIFKNVDSSSTYAKTRKTVRGIVDTWWPKQEYGNHNAKQSKESDASGSTSSDVCADCKMPDD